MRCKITKGIRRTNYMSVLHKNCEDLFKSADYI